jgi:hypothetical protein
MKFIEQITDVKLTIETRPRTYISWRNTEEGRDKFDCYERVDFGGDEVGYNNIHNRNQWVNHLTPFWYELEKIYWGLVNQKENESRKK